MLAKSSKMWSVMITLAIATINSIDCHPHSWQQERKQTVMSIETNIGIPIETQAFLDSVAKYTEKMTSKAGLGAEEHVTLVRLLNTIQSNKLENKQEKFKKFTELYRLEYMSQSISTLEATLTKGMAWYSKAHDIYIGGKPHQNSQFKLDDSFLKSLH